MLWLFLSFLLLNLLLIFTLFSLPLKLTLVIVNNTLVQQVNSSQAEPTRWCRRPSQVKATHWCSKPGLAAREAARGA